VPRRRCVGCGRIAPKRELIRIAAAPGGDGEGRPLAVLDAGARMPGRGAYLCSSAAAGEAAGPISACLALALRRGAIARALRAPVTVDPKLVESVGP